MTTDSFYDMKLVLTPANYFYRISCGRCFNCF